MLFFIRRVDYRLLANSLSTLRASVDITIDDGEGKVIYLTSSGSMDKFSFYLPSLRLRSIPFALSSSFFLIMDSTRTITQRATRGPRWGLGAPVLPNYLLPTVFLHALARTYTARYISSESTACQAYFLIRSHVSVSPTFTDRW